MNNIIIKEVKGGREFDDFINLPYEIYNKNPYWVAPIKKDYIKAIKGEGNELSFCPHKLFIAYRDDKPVARLIVFIDKELNETHNLKAGYICEFESYNDDEASKLLFLEAEKYLKEEGMNLCKGPVSLPGGDDKRGVIIDNFDDIPTIMNTYNLSYYKDLFTKAGFEKYHDVYAFRSTKDLLLTRMVKIGELLPKIQERYGYRVDTADIKKNIQREMDDVYKIIEEAMPKDWEDFKRVSKREIEQIIVAAKPFLDEDLVAIARTNEGRPIGFALSLPDYNEILHGFKGKLGPKEMFTFMRKKNKLKRIRMFVLFVVPDFHKKGVSAAIYHTVFMNGVKKGYEVLEGSTIWDYNQPMLNDINKVGAEKSITYRVYKKDLL
ncbi:GNAT family N-acetyltransferase [Peptoniphilus sp. GNH]|nr:hypothetical protein HMPREF3189_00965 [Clostridiales bacterium KA00134]UHR03476.1 GNAT family N-acetyltransferase [Peptoniphilus sp. GNH]